MSVVPLGRRWIGIDISEKYIDYAERRMKRNRQGEPLLLVGRAKYPGKEELAELAAAEVGTAGPNASAKHRRQTYGRGAPESGDDDQLLYYGWSGRHSHVSEGLGERWFLLA